MPRYSLLPVRGVAAMLLAAIVAAATLPTVDSAKTFQYSNLHRDVYLNLIGLDSRFGSDARTGRAVLESALDAYSVEFVNKFSACVAEEDGGGTIAVKTMSVPEWTVYSHDTMQQRNANGDGYVQHIKWNSKDVVVTSKNDDEPMSEMVITKCTRRSFNIGKPFIPVLLEVDSTGMFESIEKAKVLTLSEYIPPNQSNQNDENESDNDNTADSELIQDNETKKKDVAPAKSTATASTLERCPVTISVKCTGKKGTDGQECNDVPIPSYPDCVEKVEYAYKFTVVEDIRLKSVRRYRKGARLGCDNGGKKCEIRDYLEDLKNQYLPPGTVFTAEELVCEDARHDTRFELTAQRKTYNGSWVNCIISDNYEDTTWSKNVKAAYMDLVKSVGGPFEEEPASFPTYPPSPSPNTDSPVMPPTTVIKAPTAASPVVSPTEPKVDVIAEPEEVEEKKCIDISLTIACNVNGINCDDVLRPTGDDSDPCTREAIYEYKAQHVGNSESSATFSKLMRSRTGSNVEVDPIDFLPMFESDPLVLSNADDSNLASLTEKVTINFCESQVFTTSLVAEFKMEADNCASAEEYVLQTPVPVPGMNENSEDFDVTIDPGQASKESEDDAEENPEITNTDSGSITNIMEQSTSSVSAVLPSFTSGAICSMVAFCLFFAVY